MADGPKGRVERGQRGSAFYRLGARAVRRRWIVLGVWILFVEQ